VTRAETKLPEMHYEQGARRGRREKEAVKPVNPHTVAL
jgi:hypothetical protein